MRSISTSGTAVACVPKDTTERTPGVLRTGVRCNALKRQKTYPGNKGTVRRLVRSDQRRDAVKIGRKLSRPLLSRPSRTAFSCWGFTVSANQGKDSDRGE